MTTTLNMPDVGESVTEGTVTRWLKHEGDTVVLDEPLVEIETEKVEVEVPSPFEGRLVRILVQEGEVAAVGAALAEFAPAVPAAARTDNRQQTTEGAPARAEGAATSDSKQQTAKDGAAGAARAESREQRAECASRPEGVRRMGRYSPVVLKLAGEHGIDLALVRGSGIDGRVTRQDVMRYIENPVAYTVPPPAEAGVVGVSAAEAPPLAAPLAQPATPAGPPQGGPAPTTGSADEELVPLTATRRTIAARMLEAHQSVPVAWMAVEADVTGLVQLRAAAKEQFLADEGVALTYLPFFVQAIAGALRHHPALNATYTNDGIRIHHRLHLGIAIATEAGLIVPVIRDADRKSVSGLARELQELGEKARSRKLGIDDVRGGTFTIDNTGAFGSVISQPIIPPGQAAIITTEVIRREPRATGDGSIAARSVMNLCISFDHRALDGAEAGLFMRAVKANLEAFRADQPVY
ncbi:MAG: 2-oxo acid dehydrogenase subunit E2 [Chloroflexi bacterium]|nr:2-oxo acid dehydrogenase subunit E2 [Chloroflexota bacterium]